LPGTHQILAELIHAEIEKLRSEIYKLMNSDWNKEEFIEQRKKSNILPIYRKGS
jgi:hypothetical protein